MSDATPSASPRIGQESSAKPSRDAVIADREANKAAKRAAKEAAKEAAAARKAAGPGTGGNASTEGGAKKATAAAAQAQAPQQANSGGKKQQQQQQQQQHQGGSDRATTHSLQIGENSKSNVQQQQQMPSASRAQRPMAETDIVKVASSKPLASGGVSLFGNVSTSTHSSEIGQQIVSASYRSQVHPSVLKLAHHLSNFTIVGADARAIAVLKALRDFIVDYRIAGGAVFNRDLVTKLGPQISFLVQARPLGASVGHAIRYLKYEISVTPVELNEDEAKEQILSRIDHFVRDRITYATVVIAQNVASSKIKDGDVVLTFARSSVVQQTIVEAWDRGKRFSVIIVDARPLCEGRGLLSTLVARGIPCTYGLLTSLSSLISQASLVLLGTASLLANGALYSRAGTAPCAMMAKSRGVPVIVCCETYKFSERVQLDGFVINEAGDPTDILSKEPNTATASPDQPRSKLVSTAEWKNNSSLGAVNLLYDLTPPRYITAVASEVGLSGPESVGVILRDYKSVLYGQ